MLKHALHFCLIFTTQWYTKLSFGFTVESQGRNRTGWSTNRAKWTGTWFILNTLVYKLKQHLISINLTLQSNLVLFLFCNLLCVLFFSCGQIVSLEGQPEQPKSLCAYLVSPSENQTLSNTTGKQYTTALTNSYFKSSKSVQNTTLHSINRILFRI